MVNLWREQEIGDEPERPADLSPYRHRAGLV